MKNNCALIILAGLLITACGGETLPPQNELPDPLTRDGECSNAIAVTPTRLRRLTHREYDNAVRDLLNTPIQLADDFPGDIPAAGFASNRGDPLAELGAEKLLLAAEQHADNAMQQLDALLPCTPNNRNRSCALQFINDLGRQAFRRALTSQETDELGTLFDWAVAQEDLEYGIRAAIEYILQSPNFLYQLELTHTAQSTAKLTGLSIASRLAAMLWQSIPDAELLQAAENGELDTPEGIVAQTKRMLAHDKGRDGVVEFFNQWLDIEKLGILEKDPTLFPEFTPALRAAMWEETTTFVDYVVRHGDGLLSTLFTSNLALAKEPLASLYGIDASNAFEAIDASVRSGVLTHPSFLAVHAHGDQTSPVKRGVFVRDRLMCSPLPEAPANVNTNPPAVDPSATTRERFSQHRDNPACAGCHNIIDPLGFAFEHFDAMGRYRTMEGPLAIDASGELVATVDMDGPFDGAHELNHIFAHSVQVRDCMATQWLRYAIREHETSADACSLQQAKRALAKNGNIQELIFAVVQSDAFRYKSTGESQ